MVIPNCEITILTYQRTTTSSTDIVSRGIGTFWPCGVNGGPSEVGLQVLDMDF